MIGGAHDDNTHRDPIMDMLRSGAVSSANGIGLLFIEELSEFAQDEIDAYLASPPGTPMTKIIQDYLWTVGDTQGKFNFIEMVDLAKQRGVRVVGTDAAEAKVTEDIADGSGSYGEIRTAKQNHKTEEIMRQALAASPNPKFVALVGDMHTQTHSGGVPGITQIMNVPGLNATPPASWCRRPRTRPTARRRARRRPSSSTAIWPGSSARWATR